MTNLFKGVFFLCFVVFLSCKKDRLCECTTTETDTAGNSATSYKSITYKNIKKKDAEDACKNSAFEFKSTSGSTVNTGTKKTACSLK